MKNFANLYLAAVKKFMPAKVVRPSVGIDIGTSSCRMVEVLNTPEGCQLLRFAVEPIKAGDVVKAVRAIMTKTSSPNISPATGITGKGTLIRFVEMPKMGLEDLKRSFSYEVDKYFPFPKDQIYTDCHILDTEGKDNKFPVLVAAAKKEMVNVRMKLLTDAGLPAEYITLNSIAIANVIDVLGSPKEEGAPAADKNAARAIAILDVGELASNLTIFVNDRPKFNRDISVGGRDFTKSLSTSLNISVDEAEARKQKNEPPTPEMIALIDTMISDLVSELRLSVDYFVTETNLTLNQLYLTGGGAMMKGIPESLSKQLEMQVKVWEPLRQVKPAAGINADELKAKADQLGIALGLALYS